MKWRVVICDRPPAGSMVRGKEVALEIEADTGWQAVLEAGRMGLLPAGAFSLDVDEVKALSHVPQWYVTP